MEEDGLSVKDVYVRGWKVDEAMMEVFGKCWPAMPRLQTLHLWNVGLTANTLDMLTDILPHCIPLITLVLDGNTLTDTHLSKLVTSGSPLRHLSLRFCQLGDSDAISLALGLGFEQETSNKRLLTLNLSNNHISDLGTAKLAEVLKMNRTLLMLNLASNKVGDEGTVCLATVLSFFPLNQQELVERRQLLSQQACVPYRQTSKVTTELSAPQVTIKDPKDKAGFKERSKSQRSKDSGVSTPTSKKGSPGDSKVAANAPQRKKRREKVPGVQKTSSSTGFLAKNPLTNVCTNHNGRLWLEGNRTLLSLNLSRNKVGPVGLQCLRQALQDQMLPSHDSKPSSKGLRRLELHTNRFQPSCPDMEIITKCMRLKDPLAVWSFLDLGKPTVPPCSRPLAF